MANSTISRTIHFYDLIATFNPNFILDPAKYTTNFQALLSQLKTIVSNKEKRRYQQIGEKVLFINELVIKPSAGKMTVQGKILSVRKDFFPELLNTNTDITRDIAATDEEGIVETTHFIIQQKSNVPTSKLKIALEYNQFGAKISELEYYLNRIGTSLQITENIEHVPIVRDSLKKTKNRIGEISKILIRISKDNIGVLQTVDKGIFTAFEAAQNAFQEEYITMELKYEISKARQTPTLQSAVKSKNIVSKLIDSLINDKTKVENYEKLEIIAEDSDKNDRLNAFDLLIDKAKDILQVERREKSRTIISLDMFAKMNDSWQKHKIL